MRGRRKGRIDVDIVFMYEALKRKKFKNKPKKIVFQS